MKLHALGSLSDKSSEQMAQEIEAETAYIPFVHRSPFQGYANEFENDINSYFQADSNQAVDLWNKTVLHVRYWHNVDKLIGIKNNFLYETWLNSHLRFSRDIGPLLNLHDLPLSLDIWLEPATCGLQALRLVHRKIDIFRQNLKNQIERTSIAAKNFENWLSTVKLIQKESPFRLYTTNWDSLPELVSGFNGWRIVDGFKNIQDAFSDNSDVNFLNLEKYHSIVDPDAYENQTLNGDRIDLLRLHGGLDWYTNGAWVAKSIPLSQTTFLGKLYSKGYEDVVHHLGGWPDNERDSESNWKEKVKKAATRHNMLSGTTSYVRDMCVGGALIHPTDAKGYPKYQPMRTYAHMLENDLAHANYFWIIGHSLGDKYFVDIIERSLSKNKNLKIIIQDPDPSESAKMLSERYTRINVAISDFGDTRQFESYL